MSDVTEWDKFADSNCSLCHGTGEVPVPGKWRTTALCTCAQSWRQVHADAQQLRDDALDRFDKTQRDKAAKAMAAIAVAAATAAVVLWGR